MEQLQERQGPISNKVQLMSFPRDPNVFLDHKYYQQQLTKRVASACCTDPASSLSDPGIGQSVGTSTWATTACGSTFCAVTSTGASAVTSYTG